MMLANGIFAKGRMKNTEPQRIYMENAMTLCLRVLIGLIFRKGEPPRFAIRDSYLLNPVV